MALNTITLDQVHDLIQLMYPGKNLITLTRDEYDTVKAEWFRRVEEEEREND
jgi:hypothetical protein